MTMEEAQELINARGRVKASLTRMETFVRQFTDDQDILSIKLRISRLSEIWVKYEQIQDKLEVIDNNHSDHDEDRTEFETNFYRINVAMQRIIDNYEARNTGNSLGRQDSERSMSTGCQHNLKLPAIKLPSFSGEYEHWITFSDMFKAIVHDNEQLTHIQKFHYLKSALQGEAERLISNLPMTTSNYVVAWKLLVARFENKRLIAASHIRQLLEIKQIYKESASELAELVNSVSNNVNALDALDIEAPLSEVIISQVVTQKLDLATRKAWELKLNDTPFPPLKDFISFLEKRRQALENVESTKITHSRNTKANQIKCDKSRRDNDTFLSTSSSSCPKCKQCHPLYKCDEFINSPLEERRSLVIRCNLCFNCLQDSHRAQMCPNKHRCKQCTKSHHTLLHRDRKIEHQRNNNAAANNKEISPLSPGAAAWNPSSSSAGQGSYCSFKQQGLKSCQRVLLATAVIKVIDARGQPQTCRILLDGGSQSSYVTEDLAQRLSLKRHRNEMPINGINGTSCSASHSVDVKLTSKDGRYKNTVTCFILPTLTGNIPRSYVDISRLRIPKNIQLADEEFNIPGKIDMLIGSDMYPYLMKDGRYTNGENHPVIQETSLGWVLLGRVTDDYHGQNSTTLFLSNKTSLESQIRRFWEQEEVIITHHTKEEKAVEQHFKETTSRDETGRFIVKLPRHSKHPPLGDSYIGAERRFLQLEKKLTRNKELDENYKSFMQEYVELGHMQLVSQGHRGDYISSKGAADRDFFLPHHAVLKPDSITTKTRVVFDASAKTSTGISLNDILMTGPTIQQDLLSIVTRFRTHTYAITADISKMYRQIRIHPDDYNLQRILWRFSPDEDLKQYQLLTVTYGTSPASFLATRCLLQLAIEDNSYPQAAEIVKRDFYMDDLLTGCKTIEEAIKLREELQELLIKGGFPLRKWCSNSSEVLATIPQEDRAVQSCLKLDDKQKIKTLGLVWYPSTDKFQFEVNAKPPSGVITKRSVMSVIASIFDPLGLLGPSVVIYKIFMQQLWKLNISWDEELPQEHRRTWTTLHQQISRLNEIEIDRRVLGPGVTSSVQVHGFSDASEKAYAACVYVRTMNDTGDISVNLLSAKSRVAPLKQVSLPRLELCAALLLAKLIDKVIPILNLDVDEIHLWTDSTIVLAWVTTEPTRWQTYVANRVSEIQQLTSKAQWHHVPSEENAADILSRGLEPKLLRCYELWWHGPSWLGSPEEPWPSLPAITSVQELPEQRKITTCTAMSECDSWTLFSRFSSLHKLLRVLAYCIRFVERAKGRRQATTQTPSCEEMQLALQICIRRAQREYYLQEIEDLQARGEVTKSSKLRSLHPFLDKDHVLRVGGRIERAEVSVDQQHPVILPPKHQLTLLIIRAEHLRLLHASSQLLIASLRSKFWIVNAKQVVRQVIHRCITCYRFKVNTSKQLMGQLPTYRVQQSRPFLNSGVDFGGPFMIRQGSPRSKTRVKCYMAVFICLCTKAVHIEFVSDLSTEAFLAALRRFTARRGKVQNMFSDNGKNFVGSNNKLRELYNLFRSAEHINKMQEFSRQEAFSWHFIPPNSPHFGGIWEAAIKSIKYHLRRVAGNASLNFEEMTTLLYQIEACLNSRPITALSNDPQDPSYLSPGHFLIGQPLMAFPEPDITEVPMNKLSRWQRLQRMQQYVWKRWSTDYLSSLQQRTKWMFSQPNVVPGTIVIVKENNLPPLSWRLGLIKSVFKGADGLVRVADVRIGNNVVKRPIHNLCVLPIDD